MALTQPLVDAHLLRQCQTAAATRSIIEEPGIPVSARVPWAGDFDERFVLELPIYNYLVAAVHAVIGHLTLSGKLVSIALWALSFWLLQGLWRRMLDPASAAWANLLFVVSPLGVFYAQAFMPEMLVQAVAFAFVFLLVRYDEQPTLLRWTFAAGVGLLALVVKAPAIVHLYLIFLILVVGRRGWRGLFLPRYVIAGLVSAAAIFIWGKYLTSVNQSPLSFGGVGSSLSGFIGPLAIRFQLRTWVMIALYVGGLMLLGPALLAVPWGMWVAVRRPVSRLLSAWLLALVVYYLLWLGNGPAGQSYYNLPALAPLCALFGLGMNALLASAAVQRWRRVAAGVAVALTVGCAVPVWFYLFKPDRAILSASLWAAEHTEPGAVILFRPTHRADMIGYGANAVFPFYAQRPTFIWVPNLPEPYRSAALERTRYAVVTVALPDSKLMTALRKLRGMPVPPRESTDWLLALGFSQVAEGEGFVAFRR